MSYITRDMENLVLTLTKEYSSILITGPRQVGKTTMLKHIMNENRNYVSLDDYEDRQLANTDPAMFLTLHPAPVLIDEVQLAPKLFTYIKIAIDNGAPPGSFWLTGSQAFKLMELSQETLAGRIAILHLSSLSQHELYGRGDAEPFIVSLEALQKRMNIMSKTDISGIYERIWKGSLPAHASGKFTNRDIFYSGYLQTYISRDIKGETDISDSAKFVDFIRAAACRSGQMLNTHAIAVDVDISDDTAKRWLALLEKSDVIFYLHPYSNNLLKRTIKAPKLYFFDTGLVAYLTKYGNSEILLNGAINGAILENYVVSEVRKSYLNCGKECYLYYYRDKENNEIDLCLESDGILHPLEVKKSTNPSANIVFGFDLFKKASVTTGTGGIICTRETLSAVDKDNLIIPIWTI